MPVTGAPPTGVARVVCVDVPLAAQGLAYLSRRYPDLCLVGTVADRAGLQSLVAGEAPDVVVVGDSLPDGGSDLVAELRAQHPGLGLVLTCHRGGEGQVVRARRAGASGFVCCSAPVTALVAAIRHARAEPGSFRAFGVRQAAAVINPRAGSGRGHRAAHSPAGSQALVSSPAVGRELSAREQQVLGLLREGAPHAAIGATLGISEGTVRTHVARLYAKLRVRNRAQALVASYRSGVAARPGEPPEPAGSPVG